MDKAEVHKAALPNTYARTVRLFIWIIYLTLLCLRCYVAELSPHFTLNTVNHFTLNTLTAALYILSFRLCRSIFHKKNPHQPEMALE